MGSSLEAVFSFHYKIVDWRIKMPTAVVCAYSLVGRNALEALVDCGVEVLALYTYDQPIEDTWFEAPALYAKRRRIPTFIEPDFNAESVQSHIQTLNPDYLFSFYFREMIGEKILQIPKLGAFNLHGSLLPKYRGRAPINWVLVHGESKTGVTLHAMTLKPDDGDIFGQSEISIAWDETALSLTKKAAQAGYELLLETIPMLMNGSTTGISQKTLGKSSYFGGRKPEDSRLDFRMTAQEAFNQIRAVSDPWPNATIVGDYGSLKIAWAIPHSDHCPSGRFRRTEEGVLLGFADAALRLVTIKKGLESSDEADVQMQWLGEIGLREM
jgi:methionyl-tRNA formyltransferase